MLTLESAVDILDSDLCNMLKDVCLSTPNLTKPASKLNLPLKNVMFSPQKQTHAMSAVYRNNNSNQLFVQSRKNIVSSPPVMENKGGEFQSLSFGADNCRPAMSLQS